MITVAETATFKADVTIVGPNDAGDMVESSAKFTFNYFTREEFEAMDKALKDGKLPDAEFLKKVVAGWGADVVDSQKASIEFNDENFGKVMSVNGLKRSLIETYFKYVNAATAGNLKALLSPAAAEA